MGHSNRTGANQFLGSLSADGSSLVYGTYISTNATALGVDASGDAYVAGMAVAGFPVSAGAFEQCYSANAFAAEFSPAGALVGATYFGLSPTFSVGALAVGQNGLVSIGADGQQGDFVANLLIRQPAAARRPLRVFGCRERRQLLWFRSKFCGARGVGYFAGRGVRPGNGRVGIAWGEWIAAHGVGGGAGIFR